MPSRTPRVDESAQWRTCALCGATHGAGVACPPTDVWLVGWATRVNGRRRGGVTNA